MGFKSKVRDILSSYAAEIMNNYNQTALLLDSCEKAATYYHAKSAKFQLATTDHIPEEFKLNFDTGSIFCKKELMEQYEEKLQVKIVKDYLITTVATCDSMIEALYEQVLMKQEKNKPYKKIEKQIKWGKHTLPSDLITRLPILQAHAESAGFRLEDFLNTYEYLRQITHATIHAKGKLQECHLRKMQKLESKMDEKQRLSVNQLHDGENVLFTSYTTYMLRHWCITFISLVMAAFAEAAIPVPSL